MKKFLVGLGKVLFWLGFFINFGLFSFFGKTIKEERERKRSPYGVTNSVQYLKKEHSRQEESEFSSRMFLLARTKELIAREKIKEGRGYSAYDYFCDYREFTDSAVEFGIDVDFHLVDGLHVIAMGSSNYNYFNYDDIDSAQKKFFPEMHNHEKKLSEVLPSAKAIGWWWFALYLKMLPLVFLLFLLWIYEDNEYKKVRLRNPMSFIISVLLHPYIITRNVYLWWRNIKRELGAEIEIRRSKDKLFHLLSKDEVALAKKFAQSNLSFGEFRQQLRRKGYVPRHHFVPVALAFLLTSLIPTRGLATSANFCCKERTKQCQVERVHLFSSDASPGANVECLNLTVSENLSIERRIMRLFYVFISATCRGHHRGIDHVPLVIKSNSTRKTFNNNQNKSHEIYYFLCAGMYQYTTVWPD